MTGAINPTREQFQAFKDLPRDEPALMLNLVRLRDQAEYPDGRTATGSEAYAAYGRDSAPVLKKVGGSILWRGAFRTTLIGPQDEAWDHCFIALYPEAAAFLAMITDPDYQKAVIHRTAAVSDSRLIRLAELPQGDAFAD